MAKMSKVQLSAQPLRVQQVIQTASDLVLHGCKVHFKFTCEKCGARIAFTEPNSFYEKGECDQCGHISDTRTPEAALNYMVVASSDESSEYLAYKLGLLGTKPEES